MFRRSEKTSCVPCGIAVPVPVESWPESRSISVEDPSLGSRCGCLDTLAYAQMVLVADEAATDRASQNVVVPTTVEFHGPRARLGMEKRSARRRHADQIVSVFMGDK